MSKRKRVKIAKIEPCRLCNDTGYRRSVRDVKEQGIWREYLEDVPCSCWRGRKKDIEEKAQEHV